MGGVKVVWESGTYMFIRGMTYVLNEGTLVLEGVTLAQVVELVVQVLVDLAGGTVADEETTENTHAAHPEDLAVKRKKRVSNFFSLQFHQITPLHISEGDLWRNTAIRDLLHTWAYGRPWYPYAYPDRGDDRCGEPRSARGRGSGSAW